MSSVERNNEYGRKDVARVSFGTDSGAAATMLPQDWRTGYPLEKVGIGKGYYSASGEAIPDLGLRRLVVTTAGSVKAVRARVTKVRRALISVYDMCLTRRSRRRAAGSWLLFSGRPLGCKTGSASR